MLEFLSKVYAQILFLKYIAGLMQKVYFHLKLFIYRDLNNNLIIDNNSLNLAINYSYKAAIKAIRYTAQAGIF